MPKRLLCLSLLCILLLAPPLQTKAEETTSPNLNAKQAILLDQETGRRLYEKDSDTPVPMASTTKIMTALVVLEECELTDRTTVSAYAAAIGGSTMHLAEGEEIGIHDLLYGLLLCSGNDAAVALAEHVGGSVPDFCNIMNRKAREWGLTKTNYTSPHGLDADGHYTTAYELAVLARRAMENPQFRSIVATKSITVNGHYCSNTNPLLGLVDGVDGIKTGYTDDAGRCLVLTAERDGFRVIGILLGCESSALRILDGRKLLDYAFSNYRTYTIQEEGAKVASVPLWGGFQSTISLETAERIRLTLSEEEYQNLEIRAVLRGQSEQLKCPLQEGEEVGTYALYTGEQLLYQGKLLAGESVERKGFWDFLRDLFWRWCTLFSTRQKSPPWPTESPCLCAWSMLE